MSKLQLNFNGGEIDPDEQERVDLALYDTGLSFALNVIARPHGGLSRRGGLRQLGRVRHQVEVVPVDASMITMPNGGVVADLLSGTGTVSTAAMAENDLYVVAEFDLGADVAIAAIDLNDFYLADGSPGAGDIVGGVTPGGGTIPDSDVPGYFRGVYDPNWVLS